MALNLKKIPSKARNPTEASGPVLFSFYQCVCLCTCGWGARRIKACRAPPGGVQKKRRQKPWPRSDARFEP